MYHYTNPADYDDPEPPPVAGRCVGFQKGCGRFVANGGTLCPRCAAEGHVWTEHERNEDARIAQSIADEKSYWEAYWKSPEGLAEIEAEQKRTAEYWDACDAHEAFLIAEALIEGQINQVSRVIAEMDDDLPF